MLKKPPQPKTKQKSSNVSQDLFPLKVEKLVLEVNAKKLINNLSFELEADGITALIGPNGAGKSLTLRLLHNLIEKTSGTISWNNETNQELIQNSQAMVFQKPVLLRRSVIENLRYNLHVKKITGKAQQSKLIEEALTRAGLTKHANNPARLLSGGEQQKLAMARALMTKPSILFLDEPTASLDPNATLVIEDLIKEAEKAGTKIILVTHDIGQAKRLAEEIIFLNQGQVSEQGPTQEMIASPKTKPAQQYFAGEIVIDNQ
jgi:tungstate transport system ATP-binding protein